MKETLHILCRVSTRVQIDGYSLDLQKEQGIKYSKSLGMNHKVYNEGGVSGTLPLEDRPQLFGIIEKIKEGKIKHLWVKDLSRLSRNSTLSMTLQHQFEENGCSLHTETGVMDFQNDYTEMLFGMISLSNSIENKIRRKKSMEGKVRHFQSGGFRGGTFPYGYESLVFEGKKMLVPHEQESKWVRKMFEWYDNGKSTKWIGEQLDTNGMKPRRSKIWSLGSIQKILGNDLYIGRDEMIDKTTPQKPKKLYYQNDRLRIVDNEIYYRVLKRLDRNSQVKKHTQPSIKNDVVLRGRVRCGSCGLLFNTRVNPNRYENYMFCPSKEYKWKNRTKHQTNCKNNRSINIPQTEELVWNTLVDTLENSHILKEQIKGTTLSKKLTDETDVKKEKRTLLREIKKTEKEVVGMDKRLTELFKNYTLGRINRTQLDEIELVIVDEKTELMNSISNKRIEIQNLQDKIGWVDWLNKHKSWITDLSKITDYKGRTKILDKYLDKVVVYWNKKTNNHSFRLRLKLPIVEDKLIKKGKEYKVGMGNYSTKSGSFTEKSKHRTIR